MAHAAMTRTETTTGRLRCRSADERASCAVWPCRTATVTRLHDAAVASDDGGGDDEEASMGVKEDGRTDDEVAAVEDEV